MELWVSGFNAWGQLDFQGDSSTEPPDVRTFKSALRDQYIEIQWTTLSATLSKSRAIMISGFYSLVHMLLGRSSPRKITSILSSHVNSSPFFSVCLTSEVIRQSLDTLSDFWRRLVKLF